MIVQSVPGHGARFSQNIFYTKAIEIKNDEKNSILLFNYGYLISGAPE
jgi:hypothetical protein